MSTPTLDAIVASVRGRSVERQRERAPGWLEAHARPDPARRERILSALTKPELAFIVALERRSPSGGVMFQEARQPGEKLAGPRWHALADAVRAGGADVLAVGTEEDHYNGELEDLRSVAFTQLPVMRADFVVDESMVRESCAYGADAITLIAKILDDATLARLRGVARQVGLAVLIEVHEERELERALPLEPELLGVNARDRRTMEMDAHAFERLLPRVRKPTLRVALSGLASAEDMRRARAAGADVALIGGALMKAADPAATLSAWKTAVRGR